MAIVATPFVLAEFATAVKLPPDHNYDSESVYNDRKQRKMEQILARVDTVVTRNNRHSAHVEINHIIIDAAKLFSTPLILEVTSRFLNYMNFVNFATVFHRLAKLRPRPHQEELEDPRMFELQHRLRAAATSTSDLSPWCMSLVVWSYATLGMRDPVLFSRVAELAAPRLMEFKPVELTNAVWALAMDRTVSPLFFEAAAVAVAARAQELSASCTCLLCWSLATALPKVQGAAVVPVVATALAQQVALTVHQAVPKDIARAAWGLGVLESRDEVRTPRGAVYGVPTPKGGRSVPAHFDWTAQGSAFAAIANASRDRLEHFDAEDLHKLAWAFERNGILHRDASLRAGLASSVTAQFKSLDVRQIAALAGTSFASPKLVEALVQRVQPRVRSLAPADQAGLCEALAYLPSAPLGGRALVMEIFDLATKRKDETGSAGFTPEEFIQLRFVYHMMQLGPEAAVVLDDCEMNRCFHFRMESRVQRRKSV